MARNPTEVLLQSLVDANVRRADVKRGIVEQKRQDYRELLDPNYEVFDPDLYEVVDGDTVRHRRTGETVRFQGAEGENIDTFETSLRTYAENPKRADFHRRAYADLFGRDSDDISNQDLVNAGIAQKERLATELESARGKGLYRNKKDEFGRYLASFDDKEVHRQLQPITAGYFAPSNYAEQLERLDSGERQEEIVQDRSNIRAWTGDLATNILAGGLRMVADTAQAGLTLTGVGRLPVVRDFFEYFTKGVDKGKEFFLSRDQQARERADQREQELLRPLFNARKRAYQEANPEAPEWQHTLAAVVDDAIDRIEYLIEEPGRILDATMESLPYMLGVAAAGRKATNIATRQLKGRYLAELRKGARKRPNYPKGSGRKGFATNEDALLIYQQSDEFQKLIRQVQTRTGITTVGLTEGLSASAEVYRSVNAMTEADAEESENYQLLRKEGLSHEEAVEKLATKAFHDTFFTVTTIAAIASGITGAAGFESRLFTSLGQLTKKGKVNEGNWIGRAASELGRVTGSLTKPGLREAAEESIQSGGGEFLSQLAKFEATGLGEVGPGVGTALGEGAIVGFASGAGISAPSNIGKALAGPMKQFADNLKQATASDMEELGTEHLQSTRGSTQKARETTSKEKYNSLDTVREFFDGVETSEGQEAVKTLDLPGLQVHWDNLQKDVASGKIQLAEDEQLELERQFRNYQEIYSIVSTDKARNVLANNTTLEILKDPEKALAVLDAAMLGKLSIKEVPPELRKFVSAARTVQETTTATRENLDTPEYREAVGPRNFDQVLIEKTGVGTAAKPGFEGYKTLFSEALGSKRPAVAWGKAMRRWQRFYQSQRNKTAAYKELVSRAGFGGARGSRATRTESIAEIVADVNKKYQTNIKWTEGPRGTVGLATVLRLEMQEMEKLNAAFLDLGKEWVGEAGPLSEELVETEADEAGSASPQATPGAPVEEAGVPTSSEATGRPREGKGRLGKTKPKDQALSEESAAPAPDSEGTAGTRGEEKAADEITEHGEATTTEPQAEAKPKAPAADVGGAEAAGRSQAGRGRLGSKPKATPTKEVEKPAQAAPVAPESQQATPASEQTETAPEPVREAQESSEEAKPDVVEIEKPDPVPTVNKAELVQSVATVKKSSGTTAVLRALLHRGVDYVSPLISRYLSPIVGLGKDPESPWTVEQQSEVTKRVKNRLKKEKVATHLLRYYKVSEKAVNSVLHHAPNFLRSYFTGSNRQAFLGSLQSSRDAVTGVNKALEYAKGFVTVLNGTKADGSDSLFLALTDPDSLNNPNTPFKTENFGPKHAAVIGPMREHLIELLVDPHTNRIDENIATIFALEMGEWLSSTGQSTLNNSPEAIASFLGLPDGVLLRQETTEAFRNGTLATRVYSQIGGRIKAQLGLQAKGNPDVDPHFDDKFTAALGLMAVSTAVAMGHIEIVPIASQYRARVRAQHGLRTSGTLSGDINLLHVKTVPDQETGLASFVMIDELRDIGKSFNQGHKLLKQYFGVGRRITGPIFDLEEGMSLATKVSRRFGAIARKQRTNLEHATALTWRPNKANFGTMLKMSPNFFADVILGRPSLEDTTQHLGTVNRESVQSQRAQIERSYIQAREHWEEFGDEIFWFNYTMNSSGRIFINSLGVNPQQDKLHRFLFGMEDWKVTLKTEGELDRLNKFKKAVLLSLDVDGVKVDTLTDEEAALQFDTVIKEQNYQDVIDVLKDDLETFEQEQEDILRGVEWKEGMHTLAGLQAWADFVRAKESGKASVTVALPMETDGKTNGLASTLMQLVPNNPDLLKQVKQQLNAAGVYFRKETAQSWAEFARTGRDNYEQVRDATVEFTDDMLRGKVVELRRDITWHISEEDVTKAEIDEELKEDDPQDTRARARSRLRTRKNEQLILAKERLRSDPLSVAAVIGTNFLQLTRDFAKNPLMIFAYGAQLNSIRRALRDKAVAEFHKRIAKAGDGMSYEEAVKAVALEHANLTMTVRTWNNALADDIQPLDSAAILVESIELVKKQAPDMESLIQYRRTVDLNDPALAKTRLALENAMDAVFGHALHAALERKLGPITRIRDALNQANRLMNEIFVADFNRRITFLSRQEGRDLTNQERRRVLNDMISRGLVPMVRTPLSSKNFNSWWDSLELTSYGVEPIGKGEEKARVYFRKKLKMRHEGYKANGARYNPPGQDSVIATTVGFQPNADVGVSAVVKLIHASDGSVAGNVMGKYAILNVHDAQIGNFITMNDITREANKQFFELHRSWDMAGEVVETLKRMLPLISDGDTRLSTAEKKDVRKRFARQLVLFSGADSERDPSFLIEDFVSDLEFQLTENQEGRRQLFNDITKVEQFTDPGAVYTVEQRRDAQTASEREIVDAADTQEELLQLLSGYGRDFWAQRKQKFVDDITANLNGGNVNNIIYEWLENNTNETGHIPNAVDVLDVLYKVYEGQFSTGADTQFRDLVSLLHENLKFTDENGKVQSVKVVTNALEPGQEAAYLYAAGIIVLSPDARQPLQSLLHEMLHAATLQYLDIQETGNPDLVSQLWKDTQAARRKFADRKKGSPEQVMSESITQVLNPALNPKYDDETKAEAATRRQREAISEYLAYTASEISDSRDGLTFHFNSSMMLQLRNLGSLLSTDPNNPTYYSGPVDTKDELFKREKPQRLLRENLLSTLEELKALDQETVSQEDQALFNHVVETIVGPGLESIDGILFKMAVDEDGTANVGKVIIEDEAATAFFQRTGANHRTSPVNQSLQEISLHEILHAILEWGEAPIRDGARSDQVLHREPGILKQLEALYKSAYDQLIAQNQNGEGWRVFLPTTPSADPALDKKLAKARWDHIFTAKPGEVDGLRGYKEFITLGLTNPQFAKALATLDAVPNRKIWEASDIIGSLFRLMARIINVIAGDVFLTKPANASAALEKLAGKIVASNIKHKELVRRKWGDKMVTKQLNQANAYLMQKLAKLSMGPLQEWANRNVIEPDELEKLAGEISDKGAIAKLLLSARAAASSTKSVELKQFREAFESAISGIKKDHPLYQALGEVLPWSDRNRSWIDFLRHSEVHVDMQRQQAIEHTRSLLARYFDPNPPGGPLKTADRTAITYVILKTDLAALMSGDIGTGSQGMLPAEILGLLKDPTLIERHITALETALGRELKDPQLYEMMIKQSNGLASLMMRSIITEWNQMTNADNIARQLNVHEGLRRELTNTKRVVEILEHLTSLKALQLLPSAQVNRVAEIMEHEMGRSVEMNGFDGLLGLAKDFRQLSRKTLFNSNPTQMWKGYVYEIFDEETSVEVVENTRENRERMAKNGYHLVKELRRQEHPGAPDVGPQMLLYSINRGLMSYNKAGFSLTNEKMRGMGLFDTAFTTNRGQGLKTAAARQAHRKLQKLRKQMYYMSELGKNPGPSPDGVMLLPVLDEQGTIVDYRYVMSDSLKNEALKKRDYFDELLPSMYGSVVDRVESINVNQKGAELMYKEWKDWRDLPKGSLKKKDIRFVAIGSDVPSKAGRDMWNLLPKKTQMALTEQFGGQIAWIRDDAVNLALGFRKMTIANNEWLGQAAPAARLVERSWQEIMQWVRLRIAVLNPIVVTGNMISNIAILLSEGIPPKYIWEESKRAMIGMRKYQKQVRERNELIQDIAAKKALGRSTGTEESQLVRLRAAINNNPVHELVQEGLFTSIVEEFGKDEQTLRRKGTTKLLDKIGHFTGSRWAVKIAQEGYMVPGSELGQMALMATQYGDFIGRFVKFKWDTKVRKRDRRTSIHEALDTFIYYNIPQSKYLQYANDSGLMMFTKFFFRIQHVFARLFLRNPVQAGLTLGLQTSLEGMTGLQPVGENIANYGFMNNVTGKFEMFPWDHVLHGDLLQPTVLRWIPAFFWGEE